MLKIRLQRVGKRNEPIFRIVVTDSKNGPKSGRFLEVIGSYDSREKNETKVNADKVKYWVSKGAQLSGTLHNLFIDKGIIEGKKINVLPKKTPIIKEVDEETKGEKEGDVLTKEKSTGETSSEEDSEKIEEVKKEDPIEVSDKEEKEEVKEKTKEEKKAE